VILTIRFAICRQQKLFARQVFELHRVIKIQQLLAKKSTLSLNIDEVLVEEEADNVPIPASPVADVPVVPEIPEANGSQSSEDNSRPVPEAVCQPIYPLSVPTQQDFNAGAAWQAVPFGANPWVARMASPFMYVPYPGPCPPGYGVYPTMGAPMPMYGGSGDMQGARFPAWQQPGMSQPWGIQESVAAAAATGWYGQQPVVPLVGGAASMGTVGGACSSERPTSCAASPAVQGSNSSMGSDRQSGEKSDGVAHRSSNVDGAKNCGWAKGWGSIGEQVVRREAETTQSKECAAGPSVVYELGRREGEVGRGDGGCGAGQQWENGGALVGREERGGEASGSGWERAELEPERSWPSGASYEGPLQNRTLKRPRMEVAEVGVSPWFRIMSPSKRITQQNGVIKVVPRAVSATPESAASILLSIQKERQR
jgi:EARLY FLOWERING 3 protein